jgi:hypothetical protein
MRLVGPTSDTRHLYHHVAAKAKRSANCRRNHRLASVGAGGWVKSESSLTSSKSAASPLVMRGSIDVADNEQGTPLPLNIDTAHVLAQDSEEQQLQPTYDQDD